MRIQDLMVGDRFANKEYTGFTLEVLVGGLLHKEIVFQNDKNFMGYEIGLVSTWSGICDDYVLGYLGNFAKSENFTNLYSILSEC